MVSGQLNQDTGNGGFPDSPGTAETGNLLRYIIGGLSVITILIFAVCFTVHEGEKGVVLRFGEPVRVIDSPGLHFKAPWPIERIRVIDGRSRSISTPQTELLTRDRKNIVITTGAAWRPSDPVLLYRAIGFGKDADEKVNSLIVNATISVFGRYDLSALVSTDTKTLQIENVERDLLSAANEISRSKYGIEVVHAGFQRVSLPEQNIKFVLEQMRAERLQFATKFRSDGALKATEIRNAADLEAAKIVASANEQAAQILGKAEAKAADIYAKAHGKDPEFYSFMRSLKGLNRTLGPDTLVTLRTDAEPFRLLVTQRPELPSPQPDANTLNAFTLSESRNASPGQQDRSR